MQNLTSFSSFQLKPSITNSNNVDVIVFSVHEEYYKQCQDSPTGTYITPVPNFLKGYLQYYAQIQEDKGSDDYELPEVADYAYCTRVVIQNEERWLQIGCADDDQTSIAVNIYTDNTCQTRYKTENGYDDANIDISEIQVRITEPINWFWDPIRFDSIPPH